MAVVTGNALIDGLLRAEAYPHEVTGPELIETHISWVILTGDYAYKIKKPVDFGFLDFTSLEKRLHFCDEELRLNKSWAPELYLDVVPVTMIAGKPRMAAKGRPVEYAVRMRQFGSNLRLDHQIERGELGTEDVLALASEIAERHLAARKVEPSERLSRVTAELIIDNYDALVGDVPDRFLSAQRRWMNDRLERYGALMGARAEDGFFRECHGDLKLANLVRLPEGIRAFDCIEFNRDLRDIDVVADYAFLTMELKMHGAADLASLFLNRYLERTGDYQGACLLPIYEVYRSLVGAKIFSLKLREAGASYKSDDDRRRLQRYRALARAIAMRRRPVLIAMSGYSASGKSWLSSRLIPALRAVRLRSDLERKRLADIAPTAGSQSGVGSGLYDSDTTDTVYAQLFETAGDLLRAGVDVILDASFLSAAHRRCAREVAARAGAQFALVRAHASEQELTRRLEQRAGRASVSEADISVLRYQLKSADPLTADEAPTTISVNTENQVDLKVVLQRIRRVAI